MINKGENGGGGGGDGGGVTLDLLCFNGGKKVQVSTPRTPH